MPQKMEINKFPRVFKLIRILAMLFFIFFTVEVSIRLPVWGDEYFTYKVSILPLKEGIQTALNDAHPPLYWIFSHWVVSYGNAIHPIRLFSVLGTLGFLMMMSLLISHYYSKEDFRNILLLIFALIASTSPFILLFMPMARYYWLVTFFTICSLGFKLDSKGGWFCIICVIIFDTLLLYTNFLAGLILLGGNIYLLTRKRKVFSHLQHLLIWILPWLFFSPIIGYFTRTITRLSTQDIFKADFGAGLKGFAVRLLYSIHVFISGEFIYPWQPFGIIMLVLAMYLLYRFIRYGPSELKSLLGWGILMPALLTILGSITLFSLGMEFLPPRIAFVQPFLLLAIAIGLGTMQSRPLRFALLILFLLGNLHADYNLAERENYLHSTYIIPWEQILTDIKEIRLEEYEKLIWLIQMQEEWGSSSYSASDLKKIENDAIVYDDEAFMYYLEKEGFQNRAFNVSSIGLSDISAYQRIWIVFSPKDITPDQKLSDFLDSLKKAGYAEIHHEYYLEEKESARRIKEKLLGRPVSQYKKELILFESP